MMASVSRSTLLDSKKMELSSMWVTKLTRQCCKTSCELPRFKQLRMGVVRLMDSLI